ncbi:MAG: TSUP family transporter, partial [Planctomycetota bacterium]
MIALLSDPWWVFILLGICAGVISGTLGVGSGVIVVPVLVLLLGFEQKAAQGTALAVMVPMALLGAVRYWKNPEIEMNLVIILLFALGALAG